MSDVEDKKKFETIDDIIEAFSIPFYEEKKLKEDTVQTTHCFEFNHEWVNVGFHFDKIVCKKCNKVKDY